jgi:hypothetical protein
MKPKRLALRREVLGDLRSDELSLVAGGTTTLDSCDPTFCIFTLPDPGCLTLGTCNPTVCVRTIDPDCIRTLQESICIC